MHSDQNNKRMELPFRIKKNCKNPQVIPLSEEEIINTQKIIINMKFLIICQPYWNDFNWLINIIRNIYLIK